MNGFSVALEARKERDAVYNVTDTGSQIAADLKL